MNGKQLKNSILQLAIQGKIVPQNPHDEPASVLLNKIRKEKERLVKEGKLKKKDLVVEPISEEEIPFELPNGWIFARMQEISLDSADGPFGSNLKKEHYTDNKEVRIIQLSNIGEFGWKDANVKYTTFKHLPTISRSEAFAGDVIIAKMMPAGRAIICPAGESKYVLSSDAVRFNFPDILNKKYLYYAINSPVVKDQVYGEVQGITRVRTSLNKLRTYIIPVPPLREQAEIVKALENVFPIIDEYDSAQSKLDELNSRLPEALKKSILQEAIQGKLVQQDLNEEFASVLLQRIQDKKNQLVKDGILKKKDLVSEPVTDEEKPFEIPESWEWVRLNNLALVARGGSPRPIKDYITESPNGINWIKIGDTEKGGKYINSCAEKIKPEGVQRSRMVHPGDFLLTNSMSFGRPYITNVEGCIHDGWLVISQYYEGYAPDFLYYMLSSPFAFSQFSDKTAGAVVQNLNKDKVAESVFPLPPLEEQKRIVNKIEELFRILK